MTHVYSAACVLTPVSMCVRCCLLLQLEALVSAADLEAKKAQALLRAQQTKLTAVSATLRWGLWAGVAQRQGCTAAVCAQAQLPPKVIRHALAPLQEYPCSSILAAIPLREYPCSSPCACLNATSDQTAAHHQRTIYKADVGHTFVYTFVYA